MIDQRRHLDSQGRGSAENICKGHAQHPHGGVVAGGARAGREHCRVLEERGGRKRVMGSATDS